MDVEGGERTSSDEGRSPRLGLGPIVVTTGACALILQVTWHRVIALHSGVDTTASTTVTATFLGGLALGSLLGGRLADRRSRRGALRTMAHVNLALAAYAALSTPLLYHVNRIVGAGIDSTAVTFLTNTILLAVPTVLYGTLLPLVAASVTERIEQAGRRVGGYGALNTAGAAVGAFVGTWWLVGRFGLVGVTFVVAGAHAAAAWRLTVLARRAADSDHRIPAETTPAQNEVAELEVDPWPVGRWYVFYGIAGAAAVGFEQVFFRLIDGVMRSNAYTFGHVLALYLVIWAVGAGVGAALVGRVGSPRRWFLGLQAVAGVTALATLVLFARGTPRSPLADEAARWFTTEGLSAAFFGASTGDRLLFGLVFPLLLMGPTVLAFGASFPFAQALVTRRLSAVGRATGGLQVASLLGNVAGAVVAGFVLLELLGTVGSYLVLTLPGLAAAVLVATELPRGRVLSLAGVGMAMAVLIAAVPSNRELWSYLLAIDPTWALVDEDRSCATAMKLTPQGEAGLVINGRTQNAYPFDDFHIALGLLPVLAHDDPRDGLAIGFGMGSTSYGAIASGRLDRLSSVEICGGIFGLADRLAERGASEFVRLRDDPAHERTAGDGRKALLVSAPASYDVIVPDTLIPASAGSNNLNSVEFFELIASRLRPGGILAIWASTERVSTTVASVFPHVQRVLVGDDPFGPKFLLASREPLRLSPDELVDRFDRIRDDAFEPEQRRSLRAFLSELEPECLTVGSVLVPPDDGLNEDLRPRDEYFLNVGGYGVEPEVRACA